MDHCNLIQHDFPVDLESGMSGSENGGSVSADALVHYHLQSVVIDVKEESVDVDEKKLVKVKEQHKKNGNKKAAKPPRPPRGPSLDAADQKFIRELMELKRIRTERIRALKNMKAAKSSSSSSINSLFATMFTIVFCCVILLQGISNRTSSHTSVDGSPSSVAPEPGLISVQYVGKPNLMSPSMLVSGSPSLVELVSGQAPHEIANGVSV